MAGKENLYQTLTRSKTVSRAAQPREPHKKSLRIFCGGPRLAQAVKPPLASRGAQSECRTEGPAIVTRKVRQSRRTRRVTKYTRAQVCERRIPPPVQVVQLVPFSAWLCKCDTKNFGIRVALVPHFGSTSLHSGVPAESIFGGVGSRGRKARREGGGLIFPARRTVSLV